LESQTDNISLNDEVLIGRCQKGDLEAMGLLISRYQDRLYNTLLKICSNPDDAAELTQETFVKVIENITRFRGRSSFYTWLFRVGVNLTLTFCKRRQKFPVRSLEAPLENGGGGESAATTLSAFLGSKESADPGVLAEKREAQELLLRTLESMDADHRTILVLRDIEGMSYQDIAGVLELEIGTVKSRLNRARRNLRDLLQAVLA
jgi:RNA polymerase sigma-70 factor (ECF subfamily)